MADNPGRVVTKFQFSSLSSKAWFQTINPATLISGFRKVGVCPFDSTAIKPYTDTCDHDVSDVTPSTSSSGLSHHIDDCTPCLGGAENAEGGMQSPRHNYLDADVELFQRRFDNGYNIYDDPRR